MKVLGVYVRVKDKRYVAGFAVVAGDQLENCTSFAAPADRDEPGQLAELLTASSNFIENHSPDAIALRGYENRSSKQLEVADHAAGVILASAGDAGKPVTKFLTQSLWKPAGLSNKAKAAESRDALCAQLAQEPPKADEIRQAVAAARALVVRGS